MPAALRRRRESGEPELMTITTPRPTVQARPRGTGYITPIHTDSGWKFRARFPDGTGSERTVGTFDDEDGAHRELNANVAARQDAVGPSGAITLAAWGEKWIVRRADKNKRGWLSTWRTVVAAAPFADWPIDSIRRADVRDWVEARLLEHVSGKTGKPISRQTAKHALGLVKRAFAAAVDDELLEQSPATTIKLPRLKGPRVAGWTFLTLEEIELVLGQLHLPPKQRAAFSVAIYAGLREGELAALRWENVDLQAERPRLHVLGSWDDTTKTCEDRRIPLLAAARDALERWWLERGCPKKGLVWPSKQGGGLHERGYDFGWSDTIDSSRGVSWLGWKRRAGIARRVRFHDLRHTFASHCVSGSWGRVWSLREVGEMLGHTTEEVTRRYAHLARTVLDDAAAATSIRPESVRRDSAGGAQVADITGRAVWDSNPRPLAPEAQDLTAVSPSYQRADGSRTDPLVLLERLQRGEAIPRAAGEALALDALHAASELVAAASAVLGASDPEWHSRLIGLLELQLRGRRRPAAGELERGAVR